MSRDDTQCFKGMAILLMLIFHVFSQGGNMDTMWYIFLNKEILYRFSMGSQLCVSIFIFVTAYGTTMQYRQKQISTVEDIAKYGGGRYIRLMSEYWFVYIAAFLFAIYKKNITELPV